MVWRRQDGVGVAAAKLSFSTLHVIFRRDISFLSLCILTPLQVSQEAAAMASTSWRVCAFSHAKIGRIVYPSSVGSLSDVSLDIYHSPDMYLELDLVYFQIPI